MKLIYLAGPYRSTTEYGVLQNIRRAEAVALQVWQAGFAAICPHKNTAFLGGACPDSVWLSGDLDILSRCDAVLMIEGWQKSTGASTERLEALRLKIPVFENVEALVGWNDMECQQCTQPETSTKDC